MSEKVARLAVRALRNNMFPGLPDYIRNKFPMVKDPVVSPTEPVPNIVVGRYVDFGANAASPMIAVVCDGAAEGMVNVYRHLNLRIDIWLGGDVAGNVDGRRFVSIIYEHIFENLQNTNWSGDSIDIERCYETERSEILFEPQNKIYHIANTYRVEALSKLWY
jgi:hypothetical protein